MLYVSDIYLGIRKMKSILGPILQFFLLEYIRAL